MGIEQKIEQMYKALEEMQVTEKLPSVKPEFKRQAATLLLPNHFAAAQRDVEDRC